VSQNRSGKLFPLQEVEVVETLRSAAESARQGGEAEKKEKEKDDGIPVFWRVFGGTVISILSLFTITAYNNFNAGLAEVKSELSGFTGELRKDLARLDDLQDAALLREDCETVMRSVWRNLDDLGASQKELVALREQCEGLLARFKQGTQERRALEGELQALREEQAADAERKALADEVGRLKERLAHLEGRKASGRKPN
jgi:hypothetical protein